MAAMMARLSRAGVTNACCTSDEVSSMRDASVVTTRSTFWAWAVASAAVLEAYSAMALALASNGRISSCTEVMVRCAVSSAA